MIVGDQFIFIHNPRCGGSVLRASLEALHTHPTNFWHPQPESYFGTLLDFAHLRLWEIATLFPEIFERLQAGPSLVVVRDPMTRFLSALHRHFAMRHVLAGVSGAERLELFRGFVCAELSPQRILTDPLLVHFNRQKWFVALRDRVCVRHIVRFEGNPPTEAGARLGLPIPASIWRGPAPPEPLLLEDPILRRFVREYYAPDHELIASLAPGINATA